MKRIRKFLCIVFTLLLVFVMIPTGVNATTVDSSVEIQDEYVEREENIANEEKKENDSSEKVDIHNSVEIENETTNSEKPSEDITEEKTSEEKTSEEKLEISSETELENMKESKAAKTFTLYEAGNKVGDFDKLIEVKEKIDTYGNNDWETQRNFQFVIEVNKDSELVEYTQFGWPFGEVVIKSKDPMHPCTIKANQTNHETMIGAVKGSRVKIQDIIIDGNNEKRLLWVESGTSTPNDPNYTAIPAEIIIESGAVLQNGYAADKGGAIYAQRYGKITINGGEIKNSLSDNVGGAICSLSWSPLIVNGGIIHDNTAQYGGAFYLQGSSGMKHIAQINGGEILGNKAEQGGGIMAGKDAQLVIMNGKISQNIATDKGGGIYPSKNGKVQMDAGEISSNQAPYGGGVYISGSSEFIMNGGTVLANIAEKNGGGIYPNGQNVICELNSGMISQNQAKFGGGIFNASSLTQIGAVNITENVAASKGGGIYLSKPCLLQNSILSKNLSAYGAGICQTLPAADQMTLTGVEFSDNHAILMGGGMMIEKGGLEVLKTKFINNIAENEEFLTPEEQAASPENTNRRGSGGAIYAIANDKPVTFSETEFTGNKSYYGGGIWTGTGMQITNCNFKENSAYVIQDDNADLQNQGHGGAIFVHETLPEGSFVEIDNSTFVHNNADKTGGAISIDETKGIVKIKNNSTFRENYTTGTWGNGGAIYSNLHAYMPGYNDGTTGDLVQPPDPADFYINLNTDADTVFTGNKAFRTFTPPVNKDEFTHLLFQSTSHPNTKYDHILNNDDVNLNVFFQVIFHNNYGEANNIHASYFVLEKGTLANQYPENPQRDGYKFKAWNTKADGSGETITQEKLQDVSIEENKIFYAIWGKAITTLNEAPVIYAFDKTLNIGDTFDPLADVSATDKEDGVITLTDVNIVSNDVDTSKASVYHITYEVMDSQGAKTKKTVTITVKPAQTMPSQTETVQTTAKKTTPKTGESSHSLIAGTMLMISMTGIAVIIGRKKRNRA